MLEGSNINKLPYIHIYIQTQNSPEKHNHCFAIFIELAEGQGDQVSHGF